MEGPVDQIRLCDSDKDCPDGTRCLSHCNRWACVVQCIPSPENNSTFKSPYDPENWSRYASLGKIKTNTDSQK